MHPFSPRPKVSIFLASSLDGFIARTDGSLDWLDHANREVPQGEDCGFGAFFASTDILVLGRGSFEKVLTFPEWPYGQRKVIVLSSKGGTYEIPKTLRSTVSASSEPPSALLTRLAKEGFRHVYLDGGKVVQSFLREQLVDELTLTLIPVLLGSGLRCFETLTADQPLKLVRSQVYPFGYVQLTYGSVTRPQQYQT